MKEQNIMAHKRPNPDPPKAEERAEERDAAKHAALGRILDELSRLSALERVTVFKTAAVFFDLQHCLGE